ncbi:hypothetical protein KOW79_008479 [Hemibagrus wyckioides]|uniref:Immunoglobulin V-set domain-containing protein n=1 Tax=Hemibagrus wyckioides TaxID=337641 RepID=A0A9D3SM73_9TELE|nr:hypothetical protein KOW79_008479 [Hemibagrus wyckioides]
MHITWLVQSEGKRQEINMTGTFLYIVVFILFKGSCKGVLITQWPKYISSLKNTPVHMHCYQNDTDYDYTYWYRQIGNELVLITRSVSGTHNQEKGKMWVWVCRLCILLTLLSSPSDCVQFEQPQDLITNLKDDIKISCKHNDSKLDVMLWYQRLKESTALALIGYSYATVQPKNEAEFPENRFRQTRQIGNELVLITRSVGGSYIQEKGYENGFKASGTKKKWSLTVDVKEDSDAVYLCAASFHSV